MENNGDSPSIDLSKKTEATYGQNREQSLKDQLSKLDSNNQGDKVLAHCLSEVYKNYNEIDARASKSTYIRYQPGAGNINITQQHELFGAMSGIYEYQPITDAINDIPDPYNIFPIIENSFSHSKDKSNREILSTTADLITENTDVPVVVEKFDDTNDIFGLLNNGNVYLKRRSNENSINGLRADQFNCSQEVLEEVIKTGNTLLISSNKPDGDVILINESKSDDPETLKTCLHELGHVVEEKVIIPQKEEQLKDKNYIDTEVMSSLYGIKAGLMMAEIDQIKATEMIMPQVELYNWVLTGTVAP